MLLDELSHGVDDSLAHGVNTDVADGEAPPTLPLGWISDRLFLPSVCEDIQDRIG